MAENRITADIFYKSVKKLDTFIHNTSRHSIKKINLKTFHSALEVNYNSTHAGCTYSISCRQKVYFKPKQVTDWFQSLRIWKRSSVKK